jgi:hypothetical protein
MRKLVLAIIALIALFSAIRAYAESAAALPSPNAAGTGRGIQVHPGLVELGDGTASVGLAFNFMERSGAQPSLWNLLPLRIVYRNGDRSVAIGLNGLTFLLRGGVSVGMPIRIESPRSDDVISIGGKVTVDSRVQGDVWTLGADVVLTPRAEVTGDVVALGGKVIASAKSVVGGSISQVPAVKIPFLGVLGTKYSVQALDFGRQLLGYVLMGFALFIFSYYLTAHARELTQALAPAWRQSLATLAISFVLVPLTAILLIVSVVGVFFLPLLAMLLALAAFDGYLSLCVRIGGLLRRGAAAGAGGGSLYLFSSGMLGLFLVTLPALAGICLTLLPSDAAARAGQILQLAGLGLNLAGLLYGFGASLAHVRVRAAK